MNPEQLITPENTSTFYALMNMLERHDGEVHDALKTIATALNQALPRATGANFVPIRADLHINARRVTRHINHTAAAHAAAQGSIKKAYFTYLDLFTKQGTHVKQTGFDIDG